MGNSAQQPHPDNGALETLAPITLHCGAWQARVAPQYGMNMLSLTYLGQELLRTPASAADFSAAPETFGTPPLMPASRTADATFVCLCEKKTKKYKLQRKSQSANFGTSSVLFLCSFIGIAEHIAELPVDFNMLICKHIDCFYKGVS